MFLFCICNCKWNLFCNQSVNSLRSHELYNHSVIVHIMACGLFGVTIIGINAGMLLTHWGRDKMDAIFQTTFSNAFSWMKMFEYRLKFHWSLFLMVQLTISQHWFRIWLGADQATNHYLDQWWLDYRCIYASLGLNELIQPLGTTWVIF